MGGGGKSSVNECHSRLFPECHLQGQSREEEQWGLAGLTRAPTAASGVTGGLLNVNYNGSSFSFLEKLIAKPKSAGEIK